MSDKLIVAAVEQYNDRIRAAVPGHDEYTRATDMQQRMVLSGLDVEVENTSQILGGFGLQVIETMQELAAEGESDLIVLAMRDALLQAFGIGCLHERERARREGPTSVIGAGAFRREEFLGTVVAQKGDALEIAAPGEVQA